MTAGNKTVNPGYGTLAFSELVERELKSASITKREQAYLEESTSQWRAELICMKKRTEMQMTSSKARGFELYRQVTTGTISYGDYVEKLTHEKVWRCGAVRFLQQIETKIQRIKTFQ